MNSLNKRIEKVQQEKPGMLPVEKILRGMAIKPQRGQRI
jgi:hypothetical protein